MDTAVLGLAPVLAALKSRWALEIFAVLQDRPLRYTDIRTELVRRYADGRVHDKTMQVALRGLIAHQLVARRAGNEGVVYAVTPYGQALAGWATRIPVR